MEKIEGITPSMLWTFCVVLVGLMALLVLGYKVIEIMRKEHERRVSREQLVSVDITDRIADKVMEKLTPQIDEKFAEINDKFNEIDSKLSNDQDTIAMHTRQLNANEDRVKKLEEGNKALCHGVFALLSHQVNGNSIDKLQTTHDAMKNYLIDGKYNEEAWK